MKSDGFSLDDKRDDLGNCGDIDDIVERFHHLDAEMGRERTEQSFMVPVDEIRENNYDLSINKYKKIEYVAQEYPPSSDILAELNSLYEALGDVLSELEVKLHDKE